MLATWLSTSTEGLFLGLGRLTGLLGTLTILRGVGEFSTEEGVGEGLVEGLGEGLALGLKGLYGELFAFAFGVELATLTG